MNNTEALEVIFASHQHRMNDAAECIADFIEDEAVISSPSLLLALNVLWGFTLDTQPYVGIDTMFVTLKSINPEFAAVFAGVWEICQIHECVMDACMNKDHS